MPINNDADIRKIMRREKLKALKERFKDMLLPKVDKTCYGLINKLPQMEAMMVEQYLNNQPVTLKTVYKDSGRKDYIVITEGTHVSEGNKKIVSYTFLKSVEPTSDQDEFMVTYTYIDREGMSTGSYFFEEHFGKDEFEKALKFILNLRDFKIKKLD